MDVAKVAKAMDSMPADAVSVVEAVIANGGSPVAVGGCVRDALLGTAAPKDFDIEIHDMDVGDLRRTLVQATGRESDPVGRSFGVFKLGGVDFSLPRRESKVARGHKGFDVVVLPNIGFTEAARRRDLTVNAIGFDLASRRLLDPHGGVDDLRDGVLRAVDETTFGDDPLRVLRAARFASQLDMSPCSELYSVCGSLSLDEISTERQFTELSKLLAGSCPSKGLMFLARCDQLDDAFPELSALIDVPQSPQWHPEGDVWTHTLMVVDQAASMRDGTDDDALMFGALCHDFGKPVATTADDDGTVRSHGHSEAGVEPTERFLRRLRAPNDLVDKVCALVTHHLAPEMLPHQRAGAKAYRKLARTLAAAGTDMTMLEKVGRADQLGRTTELALAGQAPGCDEFARMVGELKVEKAPDQPAVMGRHLLERGWKPGPEMGVFLARCREVQDEHGLTDVDTVIGVASKSTQGLVR